MVRILLCQILQHSIFIILVVVVPVLFYYNDYYIIDFFIIIISYAVNWREGEKYTVFSNSAAFLHGNAQKMCRFSRRNEVLLERA